MKFYNREKEIEILKKLRGNFRIAITGRRRIGKTRLVEETYKDCITFFVSAEKSEKEIIDGWCDEYKKLQLPRVNTFKEFFNFIFNYHKDKVIFIDEIQNFIKVNKSFLYDLQRLIDKFKPKLILTGSLISVMKKIIENEKQPLYGRFDYIIKLKELNFETIYRICKDFGLSIEQAIKLYSVFGGIPKYYELLEKIKYVNFEDFLLDLFVYYPRPLYEEVRVILKEEFGKEYKTFFSILSAISQGKNSQSLIAGFLGKKENLITKYISLLKDEFEIIERITPLFKKKGIYHIKQNIFDFWFCNIWRYNYFIENNEEYKLGKILKLNLNKYIGRKFEDLIIDSIKRKVIDLGFEFNMIATHWGKIPKKFKPEKGKETYEIDVVALNKKTKEILFAECKWKDKVNAKKICKELIEKTKFVEWQKEKRKESYAVFAKSFSKKINEFEGKQVYCYDLKDIEKNIKKI